MTHRIKPYGLSALAMTCATAGLTAGAAPISFSDNFNTGTGDLGNSASWTTQNPGNSGADFAYAGGVIDAPPGPSVIATADPVTIDTGEDFTLTLDVRYTGNAVDAGAVFMYQDNNNYYALMINLTENSGAAPTKHDVRLFTVENGVTTTTVLRSGNGAISNGPTYGLTIDYTAVTDTFDFAVSGVPLTTASTFVDDTFTSGGAGLFTFGSNNVTFDNFSIEVVPEPGSLALFGIGGVLMLRRRRN
ncbi:MAG: PEP-CTERM sorting domain-containing protein [Planctomycetota bacterium]